MRKHLFLIISALTFIAFSSCGSKTKKNYILSQNDIDAVKEMYDL